MKSTVSAVSEDLKFKISDNYKQKWSFPDSTLLAEQENFNFGPSLLKFST